MIRNKVRHLLVEDPDNNNSVIGIITTTDLARYLQKRMKGDNNSMVTASVGDEEDKEQQREGQDKQEQSSTIPSERLLSEVWELYF
jgi:CBS domain-containing protein